MNLNIRLALAAGLALILAVPLTAQAQSWDDTYRTTIDGTHVTGNPDAEIELTEFVSYSCVHCANFAKESEAAIRMLLIQPGKMKVEVRHVIRNPVDLAVALLTECGPDSKFFANHRLMTARHDEWMTKAIIAGKEQQQRWFIGPFSARMQAIAHDLDLYDLMQPRGYSRTEMDRCLADEEQGRILATRSAADGEAFGIRGTPSFAINGKVLQDVHDWNGLRQALSAL
jgi:protein-disulfide isomerase